MTQLQTAIAALGRASSVGEYLALQAKCIADADHGELLRLAREPGASSAQRQDSLQVLYWCLDPQAREKFFLSLMADGWEERETEALCALIYRAVLERQVRSTHPERAERYVLSLKEEYAKLLFRT